MLDELQEAGIPVMETQNRGFDHGVFIPLLPAYPQAEIPIVQISIHKQLDPEVHLRLGKALRSLIDDTVGLVTTGNSYHNLPKMFVPTQESIYASEQFDAWLTETLACPESERWNRLVNWSSTPYARDCHPREDHLIPLMVAVGAAGDFPFKPIWRGRFNGLLLSSFGR